jgi:hypothetical protein
MLSMLLSVCPCCPFHGPSTRMMDVPCPSIQFRLPSFEPFSTPQPTVNLPGPAHLSSPSHDPPPQRPSNVSTISSSSSTCIFSPIHQPDRHNTKEISPTPRNIFHSTLSLLSSPLLSPPLLSLSSPLVLNCKILFHVISGLQFHPFTAFSTVRQQSLCRP